LVLAFSLRLLMWLPNVRFSVVAEMSRMLFVIPCFIWLPAKAEILSLSCDGAMKAEEEQRNHTPLPSWH
jgi:hypothetical protein